MAKPRDPNLAVPDFENQLERDLNRFVRQVVSDLSTEENSPVDTGFFASSWTASTQRPRPDQPRESHTPWSNIKPTRKGTPAAGSTINPRFIDNIKYNFKPFSTVFIGNRAKYAAFALEEGKVQSYVQGTTLGNKVKEIFREKPKIQVATKGYKGGKGIGQFADPKRVFVDYTNPYEQ